MYAYTVTPTQPAVTNGSFTAIHFTLRHAPLIREEERDRADWEEETPGLRDSGSGLFLHGRYLRRETEHSWRAAPWLPRLLLGRRRRTKSEAFFPVSVYGGWLVAIPRSDARGPTYVCLGAAICSTRLSSATAERTEELLRFVGTITTRSSSAK
ncbi:hypothetical protein MTO96_020941 [Rhipicephalus appendiculatus]